MADVEVKIPGKILATAKIKKARASEEIRSFIAFFEPIFANIIKYDRVNSSGTRMCQR